MKKSKQKNRRLKRYIRKQVNEKFKKVVLVYRDGPKGAEKFILNSRPNIDYPDVPPHPPEVKLLPVE